MGVFRRVSPRWPTPPGNLAPQGREGRYLLSNSFVTINRFSERFSSAAWIAKRR